MAESTLATSTSGKPAGLQSVSATLPTSPTFTNPAACENHTFLKPQSPRKRRRSAAGLSSPTDPTSLGTSLTPTSPKAVFPQYQPGALTGAAAMADGKRKRQEDESIASRQTSPNPARNAIGALLGNQMSGASQSPEALRAANSVNEVIATVASSIRVPELSHGENTVQASPLSMSSLGTLDSTAMGPINPNGISVASPGQIDDSMRDDDEVGSRRSNNGTSGDNATDPDEGRSSKAMTFPGPLLTAQVTGTRRGMSLPHSGLGSPRSPSTKKHKCPYCSTDFTRHHNLKSHLLTHSHEKPYLCETCDARFRRLHDLKRHTKLHTGERPHVCPKCDRSFARGDALARHNKGQGGCAGRRSSMGSYGGDDKNDDRFKSHNHDDSVSGMMYTGEASHEPERMDEDSEGADARGTSLPSIRKHDAPPETHQRHHSSEHQNAYQSRQSSTYPPVAARPPTGGLYPPSANHGGATSNSTTSGTQNPINQYPAHAGGGSSAFQASGSNVFQGSMTESPKPLSPAGHPDSGIHRNRSPSLTQHFQQQQFGRRSNTLNNSSPPMGLPPPIPGSTHSNAPHLPSLPGLTPQDSRLIIHSQATGPAHVHPNSQSNLSGSSHPTPSGGLGSPGYHAHVANTSANNSLSSHGTGPLAGSDPNPYSPANERLWSYVRTLEGKIDRLQDEVSALKNQLSPPPTQR